MFSQLSRLIPCICFTAQDGAVRLWDMRCVTPRLLGSAPSPEAAAALAARGGGARPVTAIEFGWEHGVLVTGHEGGEVRGGPLYSFYSVGPCTAVCHL